MRKKDLIDVLARKAHLTQKGSSEAVDSLLSEIQKALVRGEKVVLTGFGTFRVAKVEEKEVVVPKTGERMRVKSHRAPRFSPGRALKRAIRG